MFHVKHPRPAHPSPHQPEHATWTAACPPECLSPLTLVPASRGRSLPRRLPPQPSNRTVRGTHKLAGAPERRPAPGSPLCSPGPPGLPLPPSCPLRGAVALANPEPGGPPLRHGRPEGPQRPQILDVSRETLGVQAREDGRGEQPLGSSGGAELRRRLGRVRWM